MAAKIVRPREGDLERATRIHLSEPSGEFAGVSAREICDLCGLLRANDVMHPQG